MKKLLYAFCVGFPLATFAAVQNLTELIDFAKSFVNPIVSLLTGIAVIYFIWGIVKYIASAGDEKKAKEGKGIMVYGILALFVLFSFWGIVQLFYESLFG